MQAVTLEVILRAVFGVTDPAPARAPARAARRACSASSPRRALQLRMLVARRFGRQDPIDELRREAATVDELLYAEIAERRADPGPRRARRHPLACWSRCGSTDGERMADAELRDQLITLLLAGHETTATALAWTFDLLLRNPGALARLRAELADGGEEYLRAVITESLRLRPVVPLAGRRLGAELRVGRAPAARRHRRHPGVLAHPHPPGPLPAPARVPPRALPVRAARDLRLGPVRRRRSPLPRRRVRRVRDAGRAARGALAVRAAGARSCPGADRAAQHHLLAAARDAGRPRLPPARFARAPSRLPKAPNGR